MTVLNNYNKYCTTLTASAIINVSKKNVWDVIKFPGDIHLYHPLIKNSYMLSNTVNLKRQCDLTPMGQMIEHITDWTEGVSYVTNVVGGRMLPPFEYMQGKIEIKQITDSRTEATFTFEYKLKYGWLGNFMNILLIKPQFKSAPKKYVSGLKAYIEQL